MNLYVHSGQIFLNCLYLIHAIILWDHTCKNKPKEIRYLRLLKLIDIPIRRHVKIRADANPLDLKWKKDFDERVKRTRMLASSFSREGSLLLVSPLKLMYSEDL